MAAAARRLQKMSGQDRLLPSESGFVSFGNLCGRPLSAVADGAAPVANIVRDGRMRAKRMRDSGIGEARLRNALVACWAAVGCIHSRQPDLLDGRAVIGGKLLGIARA